MRPHAYEQPAVACDVTAPDAVWLFRFFAPQSGLRELVLPLFLKRDGLVVRLHLCFQPPAFSLPAGAKVVSFLLSTNEFPGPQHGRFVWSGIFHAFRRCWHAGRQRRGMRDPTTLPARLTLAAHRRRQRRRAFALLTVMKRASRLPARESLSMHGSLVGRSLFGEESRRRAATARSRSARRCAVAQGAANQRGRLPNSSACSPRSARRRHRLRLTPACDGCSVAGDPSTAA
jgi:hypothetical protein